MNCYATILVFYLIMSISSAKYKKKGHKHAPDDKHRYHMKDFIRSPKSCCTKDTRIVFFVTSQVGELKKRVDIRNILSPETLKKYSAAKFFVMASPSPNVVGQKLTERKLETESRSYVDILEGNFTEGFRNETHTHLLGLWWAATNCNQATFIVKLSSEYVTKAVRDEHILDYLKALATKAIDKYTLLTGFLVVNDRPIRYPTHKYYVSEKEYSEHKYPPYLCDYLYLTTPSVGSKLCAEAYNHPYFFVGDVFVTGILPKSVKINPKDMHQYFQKKLPDTFPLLDNNDV